MPTPDHVITINLNTAVDRVLEVPSLAIGAHAKGKQLSRFPAGKAINVSRALARIKRDSIATGFVGQGESGQFEQFLKDTGPGRIICQLLSVRGQTRENITLIDPVLHTDTHIRDEGFEVTDADFHRMMSKLGLLARPNAIMVFSGSLPRGMDVPKLNMLLMMALSGGAKVVLDTGGDILAQLIGLDPEESSSEAPSPEPDENPLWLVKPNQQELAQMMGKEDFQNEQEIVEAGLLLARRVRCVVVTMGATGAWLIQGKDAWRGSVEIDPGRIVNTVGCGDSMVAGLLDAQLGGYRRNQMVDPLFLHVPDSVEETKQEEPETDRSYPLASEESDLEPMDGALHAMTPNVDGPEQFLRRGLAVATANALSAGIAQFSLAEVEEIQDAVQIKRYKPS